MKTIETTNGSLKVVSTSNDGSRWTSRLYVNCGETATLTHATHRTEAGARKWATKTMRDHVNARISEGMRLSWAARKALANA
jgi:hypothetical protein